VRDPIGLDDNEREALTKISQASPTAQTLYQLVQAFRHLLHQREGEKLDGWLCKVKERYCQLKALMSFFFRKSGEERPFFGLFFVKNRDERAQKSL